MLVCLSVILLDGEIAAFVVRFVLLLYIAARQRIFSSYARQTSENTFSGRR
jgi:hypothetical protein